MKTTFTAIDFETANSKRCSICQVGLIRVENGIPKERLSILVQPPENLYSYFCTNIHGIASRQTTNSPTFDKIWYLVEPFIKNQNVVAHNGFSFDFQCLKQTLEYYNISVPEYNGLCTYRIYGENLASLCRKYSITLNHHDALSDAMACAELYQLHLRNNTKN